MSSNTNTIITTPKCKANSEPSAPRSPAMKMPSTTATVGKDLSRRVNFKDNEDYTERKKKYLTAKYGQHQMSLIKKRLRVEMWMYEQLQLLYVNNEIEIDLDELLDIEDTDARKEWLKQKLVDADKGESTVEAFIDELLEKATLL